METIRKNEDLSAALIACCNPENIPTRMGEIATAIDQMPNLDLSDDEIMSVVHRIFKACRGENGRPKEASETEAIVVDVVSMLTSTMKRSSTVILQRSVDVPRVKRMPARGSFA